MSYLLLPLEPNATTTSCLRVAAETPLQGEAALHVHLA
jgi:hypothetical protein